MTRLFGADGVVEILPGANDEPIEHGATGVRVEIVRGGCAIEHAGTAESVAARYAIDAVSGSAVRTRPMRKGRL